MKEIDSKICIVGTGGFSRETLCCLIDSLKETDYKIQDVACFMELDEFYRDEKVNGIRVIPESKFNPGEYVVLVAIGDPQIRKKIVEKLPPRTRYASVIHPSVVISEWVEIGEGSIITAGCIVTCNIKLGKHTQLNLHTTLGHDCIAGDYFTTAPGTNISGRCTFGECVYFGTNSSIKQGISITDNVTIGMGGIVTKNIIEEGVYIGSPVKKLVK